MALITIAISGGELLVDDVNSDKDAFGPLKNFNKDLLGYNFSVVGYEGGIYPVVEVRTPSGDVLAFLPPEEE